MMPAPVHSPISCSRQQHFELTEQPGASGPLPPSPELLAVPNIRPAVPTIERPRIRRLPRRPEHDHLLLSPPRRRRRISPQRQRHRPARDPQRPSDERVRPIRTHHHPCVDVINAHRRPLHLNPSHALLPQYRPRVHRRQNQPRVEHSPRNHVCRPRHHPINPKRSTPQREPANRRPVVDHPRNPNLRQQIKNLRSNPIPTRLVPRKLLPIKQQHRQPRLNRQRPQRSRSPRRPSPDYHQIPGHPRRLRLLHPPAVRPGQRRHPQRPP